MKFKIKIRLVFYLIKILNLVGWEFIVYLFIPSKNYKAFSQQKKELSHISLLLLLLVIVQRWTQASKFEPLKQITHEN